MGDFCQIRWLGQIEYGLVLELQKDLEAKRALGKVPNTLLLFEPPPTFTIGIDGHRDHLLINRDELAQRNIAYYRVERGGSIMYHGPGQLVIYPILRLTANRLSYHRYIEMLESVIIRALSAFRVQTFRQSGQRGIWALPGQASRPRPKWLESDDQIARIASIGVKVNNTQITSYGFSINVDPHLEYFDLIVPRGINSCHHTSLRHVLQKSIQFGDVIQPVIQSFCELFDLEPLVTSQRSVPEGVRSAELTNLVK